MNASSGETYPVESVSFIFQTIHSSWADQGASVTEPWLGPESK